MSLLVREKRREKREERRERRREERKRDRKKDRPKEEREQERQRAREKRRWKTPHSKRLRVYVQDASVCTRKTPACVDTTHTPNTHAQPFQHTRTTHDTHHPHTTHTTPHHTCSEQLLLRNVTFTREGETNAAVPTVTHAPNENAT